LTIDANASTKLLFEQTIKLRQHFWVIQLDQRNKTFISQIHNVKYKTISDIKETNLYKKKKKIEAELNCLKIKLRNRIILQFRKRYFRKTDTQVFDTQFFAITDVLTIVSDIQVTISIKYNIFEQTKIVQFICSSDNNLSDENKFWRRLQTIEVRAILYDRQEIQYRDRFKIIVKQQESKKTINKSKNEKKDFFLIYLFTQYLFCLNNKSLFYFYRIYEFFKSNKIINETEKYLKKFASKNQILYSYLQCRAAELILLSIIDFKNYIAIVHKIFLRE